MPEQLNLFSAFEQLLFQDAIPIFHSIEGKHKGKSYKSQYKPILEHFKDRYLHTGTAVDVRNYREKRALDGLKQSTINREHSVITRIYNALHRTRLTYNARK